MTLTPGTRLGGYDITAAIGEGGMGQVYRATDTKLKRQVALKVLPPALAVDADRLARFQREAGRREGQGRDSALVRLAGAFAPSGAKRRAATRM